MAVTTVGRVMKTLQQQPQQASNSLIGLLKSYSRSVQGSSRLTSQAMQSREIDDYYLSSLIDDSNACPYARKGDYMSSILSETKDICQAQALLYGNYRDRDWLWSDDNPTGKSIYIFPDFGLQYSLLLPGQ